MHLQPDTLLQGRYRVVRLIAQGGMGAVYQAVDERLGNTVALKQTLMADPDLRAAFEREARLLAGLQHPSLPVVSDHFGEGGGQFLVMQYIPGDDLATLLRARGAPFPPAQVLAWADALLDALAYLHGRQPPVIHRDIKPQNLKLAPHGGVVLLDFGLAKGLPGGSTGPSPSLFGYTPQYAPLEQIQGSGTDARSDLYSLAATLAELLTGKAPPDALTRVAATVRGEPDPLRPLHELLTIPPHAAAALQQALALNPAFRPPSAVAMRAALLSVAPAQGGPPHQLGAAGFPSGGLQATAGFQADPAPPPASTGATIAIGPQAQATVGAGLAHPDPGPAGAQAPAARPPRPMLILIALAVVGALLLAGGAVAALTRGGPTPPPTIAVPQLTPPPIAPTALAQADRPGASFASPVPFGQDGLYGPLRLRVLGTQRGREAWNAMRKANQFNDPPPAGYEYFLVNVAVTASAETPRLYVRLAGERRVIYTTGGVSPAPLPEIIAAGQQVEAWLPYFVAVDEADLVLHVATVGGELDQPPLMMAAGEGYRLEPDLSIEQLLPDEEGVSHREPAPLGTPAVTEDYTLTVLEARRGPAALAALVANYAQVARPRDGYEYALVLVRVRYIGDGGVLGWAGLGPSDFDAVRTAAGDPIGEAIDHPRVYVLPDELPELDVSLLPGGEYEGWTVLELPVGDPDVALAFNPGFDANGLNRRYFALE